MANNSPFYKKDCTMSNRSVVPYSDTWLSVSTSNVILAISSPQALVDHAQAFSQDLKSGTPKFLLGMTLSP